MSVTDSTAGGALRCVVCDETMPYGRNHNGLPKTTCSPRCRQRASRARRKAPSPAVLAEALVRAAGLAEAALAAGDRTGLAEALQAADSAVRRLRAVPADTVTGKPVTDYGSAEPLLDDPTTVTDSTVTVEQQRPAVPAPTGAVAAPHQPEGRRIPRTELGEDVATTADIGTSGDVQGDAAPPAREIRLSRLYDKVYLLLADGKRAGWVRTTRDGWRVSGPDGAGTLVSRQEASAAVKAAAAQLGIGVAADTAIVIGGTPPDHRGRPLDITPHALAAWSLRRGRVPGRVDVVVRSMWVGWLQTDSKGRHVACTVEGPVPGSAAKSRGAAVLALFAALYAPAPLPALGEQAFKPRRPQARNPGERPLAPYGLDQLAAAALPDNLERTGKSSYRVVVDGDELGSVLRSGRRWQAWTPDGRTVIHAAASRTEAVDALLAIPGPLFADPAEFTLHDL